MASLVPQKITELRFRIGPRLRLRCHRLSFPHATAVRVTGASPERTATGRCRDRPRPSQSSCFHRLRAELSPHRASEQFEQYYDSILVAKFDQLADDVLEGAGGHPHELTEPQRLLAIKPVEPSSLLPLPDRGDNFARHRGRLIPGADDVGDAKRRQDRAPAHRRAIDAGEEIPREERPQHYLPAPRVADPPAIARQIGAIALPQEVFERLRLAMRLRVDGVPADHGAASSTTRRETGEIRNRLGATTQPGRRPLSSAADSRLSKLACGARVSVTMIPSSPRAPARTRAASRSWTIGRPPQRRPGCSGSMTQSTSTAVSAALRIAISARSPAP